MQLKTHFNFFFKRAQHLVPKCLKGTILTCKVWYFTTENVLFCLKRYYTEILDRYILHWLKEYNIKCLNIYLSIYEICIAPLQGYYSEALPAQAQAKIKVLRSFK